MTKKRVSSAQDQLRTRRAARNTTSINNNSKKRSSNIWAGVSYPVYFVYNFISSSLAKMHEIQKGQLPTSSNSTSTLTPHSASTSTTSSATPTSSSKSALQQSHSALAIERNTKNAAARTLRRRYILSYTKNTARAVFSKRWMRQAVRWDFVGVSLSKCWGTLNSRPLPVWARRPIYEMWGKVFKCNMDEVREPLHSYPTLAAFFARELKDGARPICEQGMASPVDGRVISCGIVDGDLLEQIKGKTYSLSTFLGRKYGGLCFKNSPTQPTKLFQCIIYLSPGDYHRIHFPVDCAINNRRHFPGTLFPVNYPFLRMIPSLFALNERVVLMGEWPEGFFSLTAVGAYNVGSIELKFDSTLKTNQITRDFTCPNLEYFSWNGVGSYAYERDYKQESGPVRAHKGDECGQFHFGSTVVLVFEAPNFQFNIQPGSYVRMGQKIGELLSANDLNSE